MRGLTAAAALLIVLAGTCAAGASSNLNRVQVQARALESSLHVRVIYWVEAPVGCPIEEPELPADITDDAAMAAYDASYARWSSPRCEPYVSQDADVSLSVFRRLPSGRVRLIYAESESGFGFVDPRQGASVDFRVPYWQMFDLAKCVPGRYSWSILVHDPYRRSGYTNATSRAGAFLVRRCPRY